MLLAQTFSRFSTQMGLKIMCPVTAPLVCNSAKFVLGKLVPTGLGAVPASVTWSRGQSRADQRGDSAGGARNRGRVRA
mgnify:CR=1 FL=1